jgi:hypothetical protein
VITVAQAPLVGLDEWYAEQPLEPLADRNEDVEFAEIRVAVFLEIICVRELEESETV